MIRALLAITVLALGGVLAYQWRAWPPPAEPSMPAPVATAPGDDAPDPLARLTPPEARETYASVSERTLFRPQRKPPDPTPAEPEAPPPVEEVGSLDGIDLSAVMIAGEAISAWVQDPQANALKRLRLGDELQGWTVKEIKADRVLLERQGERNQLVLRDFAQTPPAAQPPAPVPVRGAKPGTPAAARPPGMRPRPPQPPSPGADEGPGGGQQVAPPRPPQVRPNAPKPPIARPQ